MTDSPCYECGNRNPGCHQICDRHMSWKAEHDAHKRKIWEAKAGDKLVDSFKIRQIAKTKKAVGR